MGETRFQVYRGESSKGELREYPVEVSEGMVVLDAVHQIQARHANDLTVRWNCKAGKCGSCSAEVNGKPRLMCMTRMDELPLDEPVRIEPMKRFPHMRDLVTDVSWNYEINERIRPLTPKPREADGTYRMMQEDIDRIQEFHKCIECFLCQNVCHVMRDQQVHPHRFPCHAPPRHPQPSQRPERRFRHRLLQYHQMLHRSLSGTHPHHRQRDHPPQGTRCRSLLRSPCLDLAVSHRIAE